MALSWLGSRWGTRTNAMPSRDSSARSSCMNASRPPADAPTPTTGKGRRVAWPPMGGLLETVVVLFGVSLLGLGFLLDGLMKPSPAAGIRNPVTVVLELWKRAQSKWL